MVQIEQLLVVTRHHATMPNGLAGKNKLAGKSAPNQNPGVWGHPRILRGFHLVKLKLSIHSNL